MDEALVVRIDLVKKALANGPLGFEQIVTATGEGSGAIGVVLGYLISAGEVFVAKIGNKYGYVLGRSPKCPEEADSILVKLQEGPAQISDLWKHPNYASNIGLALGHLLRQGKVQITAEGFWALAE